MNTKAFFNWSGGKDSALALYKSINSGNYEILTLLTSINKDNDRISMHGVHTDLLKKQAASIGIPLTIIELPSTVDMEEYETIMISKINEIKNMGIGTSLFGDIFLEDLKEYRIKQSAKVEMQASFPLWNIPTKDVMREFLDLGFKTIVTCVNADYLDESFVGRVIDNSFICDLPKNVDVCGENGEFHTFVFDGPIFSKPIDFNIGKKVYKEYNQPDEDTDQHPDSVKKSYGFWFCDLEI